MKKSEVQKLSHGLYRLYWKSGGFSLAAVGSLYSGKRWFAPVNWTSPDKDKKVVSSDWKSVLSVVNLFPEEETNSMV